MKKLTGQEKAKVRKYAQKEKALINVGQKEIHKSMLKNIEETFNTREVIKVKVNREDIYDKEITKKIANEIIKEVKCEIVGIIGTTIIIYKYNDKLEEHII